VEVVYATGDGQFLLPSVQASPHLSMAITASAAPLGRGSLDSSPLPGWYGSNSTQLHGCSFWSLFHPIELGLSLSSVPRLA
jgi:hypothetical protein